MSIDTICSVISVIVSIISIGIAIVSVSEAKKANDKSDKSNVIAEKANELAKEANKIADELQNIEAFANVSNFRVKLETIQFSNGISPDMSSKEAVRNGSLSCKFSVENITDNDAYSA